MTLQEIFNTDIFQYIQLGGLILIIWGLREFNKPPAPTHKKIKINDEVSFLIKND